MTRRILQLLFGLWLFGASVHCWFGRSSDWTRGAPPSGVLVLPEYNVGFTVPLKNALDYLYCEWNHKPVAFVSYGMTSAGLRAVEMLKPVLTALKMVPVHDAAQQLLAELSRLSAALRPLRQEIDVDRRRMAS